MKKCALMKNHWRSTWLELDKRWLLMKHVFLNGSSSWQAGSAGCYQHKRFLQQKHVDNYVITGNKTGEARGILNLLFSSLPMTHYYCSHHFWIVCCFLQLFLATFYLAYWNNWSHPSYWSTHFLLWSTYHSLVHIGHHRHIISVLTGGQSNPVWVDYILLLLLLLIIPQVICPRYLGSQVSWPQVQYLFQKKTL